MTRTELQNQAIDNLKKSATKTIHLDEATNLYVITDKATGEILGQYDTYQEARRAVPQAQRR